MDYSTFTFELAQDDEGLIIDVGSLYARLLTLSDNRQCQAFNLKRETMPHHNTYRRVLQMVVKLTELVTVVEDFLKSLPEVSQAYPFDGRWKDPARHDCGGGDERLTSVSGVFAWDRYYPAPSRSGWQNERNPLGRRSLENP